MSHPPMEWTIASLQRLRGHHLAKSVVASLAALLILSDLSCGGLCVAGQPMSADHGQSLDKAEFFEAPSAAASDRALLRMPWGEKVGGSPAADFARIDPQGGRERTGGRAGKVGSKPSLQRRRIHRRAADAAARASWRPARSRP